MKRPIPIPADVHPGTRKLAEDLDYTDAEAAQLLHALREDALRRDEYKSN